MKKCMLFFLSAVLAAGCAYQSHKDIFRVESIRNVKRFDASKGAVYQAFIRTALLKNFIITDEDKVAGNIIAERHIEKGKRTYIVSVQARVLEDNAEATSLFLNAKETCERTYVSDRTRFFLFIIPLPGGGGKEASQVVESEKDVRDESFYDELFVLVEENIIEESKEEMVVVENEVKGVEETEEAEGLDEIVIEDVVDKTGEDIGLDDGKIVEEGVEEE